MDWTQTYVILGVFAGFFIYMMSRMDSLKKDLEQRMDSNKKDTDQKIEAVANRMTSIEAEMKNVNQRITDMNQRLTTIEGYIIFRGSHHSQEIPEEN